MLRLLAALLRIVALLVCLSLAFSAVGLLRLWLDTRECGKGTYDCAYSGGPGFLFHHALTSAAISAAIALVLAAYISHYVWARLRRTRTTPSAV